MCMISREIESVSNTKIFVAQNSSNTSQLVIYSNYINNISSSNAMILPVPFPQTVKFINLSKYTNLFEDCDKCFYNPIKASSLYFSLNSSKTQLSKPLAVFNVGSYKVSLAMNLEQISHVDPTVFELSNGLKKILQTFYYQPYWGFIICKLNSGPENYHPLAYSHKIIDSKIYIPTRHYHQEMKFTDLNSWALGTHLDPKLNPLNSKSWTEDTIDESPMFKMEQFGMSTPEVKGWKNIQTQNIFNNNFPDYNSQATKSNNQINSIETNSIAKISTAKINFGKLNNSNKNLDSDNLEQYKSTAEDWSHTIYLMNINSKSNNNIKQMNVCKEIWDKKNLFDIEKIDFDFAQCLNFEKIKIEGRNPNIDVVFSI